jgi:hypothetical protein
VRRALFRVVRGEGGGDIWTSGAPRALEGLTELGQWIGGYWFFVRQVESIGEIEGTQARGGNPWSDNDR